MHILEYENTRSTLPQFIIICCDQNGRQTHRCGYVGVPKGHYLHSVDYSQNVPKWQELAQKATLGQKSPLLAFTAAVGATEEGGVRASPDIVLDCHGGVTYSGNGYFLPQGNNFTDFWFFGFDCHHYEDGEIETVDGHYRHFPAKSLEFCIEQCESLVKQLEELS